MKAIFPEKFEIAGRQIGPTSKPFVIAEIAQAHDGSLGMAHSFIDCAAECGVDAVKFQTHFADAESTLDEKFRVKFSYKDKTRYEYWKRMEFSIDEWIGLSRHAKERGIVFLSSPFSIKAIEVLEQLDIPAWKVASGEVGHWTLIERMLKSNKPILLSSGMSSIDDVSEILSFIQKKQKHVSIGIFQCTTEYPTSFQNLGLNVLEEFREKFNVPVGLSDHSGDPLPSIIAMARKANMIEVHLTFHHGMFGPDSKSSLTPNQLKEVCRARDSIALIDANQVDKNAMSRKLASSAQLFSRSISLVSDQKSGTVLTAEMLTLKKPGSGIPGTQIDNVVGRRLKRDASCKRLLRLEDLA